MRKLGAFHVKTHLSQLLKEIEENGEAIAITRHGHTVALITPFTQNNQVRNAIHTICKNRKAVTLGRKNTLKSMIEEGRR